MDPIDFLAWIGRHGTLVFSVVMGLAVVRFACEVTLMVARAVDRLRHRG